MNPANSFFVRATAATVLAAYTAGNALLFAADLPKKLAAWKITLA